MRRFLLSLAITGAMGAALLTSSANIASAQSVNSNIAVNTPATTANKQDVPRIITYQGQLRNSDGTAIKDGDYTITMRIYGDQEGVKELWKDTYTVQVKDGIFNLALGSGANALPESSALNQQLWLSMQIGEQDELRPFAAMGATAYALNVPNKSISADKISADYVKSVTFNGQTVSGNGNDINIQTGDGVVASVDPATNSILLKAGKTNLQGAKGGNVEGNTTISGTLTVTGSTFLGSGAGTNVQINSGLVTASRPMRSDASKNITTGPIALNSSNEVTNVLGIANGGTGAATTSDHFAFIGPISGGPSAPSFRALDVTDIPDLGSLYINNNTSQQTSANFNIDGTGTAGSFVGDGSGLTSLDPTHISSGTADINISGNAGSADYVNHSLSAGTHLSGGPFDGSGDVTIATDATDANTPSTIVARDGSGNFSAGTITAALSGNATTATTADKVAHSLSAGTHLSGGPFDGSGDVTLSTDATDANTPSTIVARDGSGNFSAGTITATSYVATGGALTGQNGAADANGISLNVASGRGGDASATAGGVGGTLSLAGGNGGDGTPSLAGGNGGSITLTAGTAGADNGSGTGNDGTIAISSDNWGITTTGDYQINGGTVFSTTDDLNATFVGVNAGSGSSAIYATAVGNNALASGNAGFASTGIGAFALNSNTTGSNNTGVGGGALNVNTTGSNNTAVGLNALQTVDIGNQNTAIGSGADVADNDAVNRTAIGYNATVTADNSVQLGNTSVTLVNTSGDISAGSSKGYLISGVTQTAGHYLRSDGTRYTDGTIQAGDVPTLNQNTTGSAATLTTPRNIWGQSFDGSAAISGTLSGVGNLSLTDAGHSISFNPSVTAGTNGNAISVTGQDASSQQYSGGAINITAGASGTNVSATAGGAGGTVNITGGEGGYSTTTPGAGGAVNITAGQGGDIGGGGTGGVGGVMTVAAGTGGDGTAALENGGTGGLLVLQSGPGGAPGAGGAAGAAGDVLLKTGATTQMTLSHLGGATVNNGNMNVTSGTYKIGGTDVLSSTTLGTNVVTSSLTTVGTIGTGVWNAGAVTSTGDITAGTAKGYLITGVTQTAGHYLRSDGTRYTDGTIQSGDVPTLNQNTTGSAATLTTPRTIWGESFDGSANISGALLGVSGILFTDATQILSFPTTSGTNGNNLSIDGQAAKTTAANNTPGYTGGTVAMAAGQGGNGGAGTISQIGGNGGALLIAGGTGGTASDNGDALAKAGGVGGDVSISGGFGGAGVNGGAQGAQGSISIVGANIDIEDNVGGHHVYINNNASAGITNIGTGASAGAVTIGHTSGTVTLPNLTASQAVVTDGSKNLTSLAYATAATATTLAERDASGDLTATTFHGALSGNASSATNASNVAVTDDAGTNADFFPTFVATNSGNNAITTQSGTLKYHPSTGTLSATTFSGAFSGTGSFTNSTTNAAAMSASNTWVNLTTETAVGATISSTGATSGGTKTALQLTATGGAEGNHALDITDGDIFSAGDLTFKDGASHTIGFAPAAGAGNLLSIQTQNATGAGNNGGFMDLYLGNGGAADGANGGGNGGFFMGEAGDGGAASASQPAGDGGAFDIEGGGGGAGTATQVGGDGGDVIIDGGNAGADGTAGPGNYGNVRIQTGAGNTLIGNSGGTMSLTSSSWNVSTAGAVSGVTTLAASSAVDNGADVTVTNSSDGTSTHTQTGLSVTVNPTTPNAGRTYNGISISNSATTGTANDIIGTSGNWNVTRTGSATFTGLNLNGTGSFTNSTSNSEAMTASNTWANNSTETAVGATISATGTGNGSNTALQLNAIGASEGNHALDITSGDILSAGDFFFKDGSDHQIAWQSALGDGWATSLLGQTGADDVNGHAAGQVSVTGGIGGSTNATGDGGLGGGIQISGGQGGNGDIAAGAAGNGGDVTISGGSAGGLGFTPGTQGNVTISSQNWGVNSSGNIATSGSITSTAAASLVGGNGTNVGSLKLFDGAGGHNSVLKANTSATTTAVLLPASNGTLALNGANTDITSLTGLTGQIQFPSTLDFSRGSAIIDVQPQTGTTTGTTLEIHAGDGGSGSGGATGGTIAITAGTAGDDGATANNGGDITITGGAGVQGGNQGTVAISSKNWGVSSGGTVTGATWQGSAVGPTYGGTGVNNGANTITLGGNISTANSLTTSGNFALTLTSTATTSVTLPTSGTLAVSGGGATAQSTPSNPTGTTSTTAVQMGLAGSITPGGSGKVMLIISGDITNGTASDGAVVQISYGTGTAPTNGAAATGTTVGNAVSYAQDAANDLTVPFTTNAVITGLTSGTAYWLDLQLKAVTGGTATLSNISISAIEMP